MIVPVRWWAPSASWRALGQKSDTQLGGTTALWLLPPALPALCAFFGSYSYGWDLLDNEAVKLSLSSALALGIALYLFIVLGSWIVAKITQTTYSGIGSQNVSFKRCLTMICASIGPFCLSGLVLLNFSPMAALTVFIIAAIWSGILLWTALQDFLPITSSNDVPVMGSVFGASLLTLSAVFVITTLLWSNLTQGDFRPEAENALPPAVSSSEISAPSTADDSEIPYE